MLIWRRERGDTMIEVLFAITIFSAVAIGGLTIMNKGTAAAQRSLEISLVRQEVDAQAEALRALHDEAALQNSRQLDGEPVEGSNLASNWNDVLARRVATVAPISSLIADSNMICASPESSEAFVMNVSTLALDSSDIEQADTYSQVVYDEDRRSIERVNGIWIEAERGIVQPDQPGYSDFYIRACWSSLGQNRPVTLTTVVRLYEP